MLKRVFVSIALLSLAHAPGQSVAPESTPGVGPEKPEFFNRVIANQKRGAAALDLYERIERVETRKNPSDPAPPTIKIMRVIPSGTGMFRIALGPDGKPRDPVVYRADLQSLARTLTLLVNEEGSQRDVLEKYAKKKKERNELINATHNAFLFTFVATEPRGDRTLSKFKMEPTQASNPPRASLLSSPKCVALYGSSRPPVNLLASKEKLRKTFLSACFWEKSTRAATSCRSATNFCPGCGLPAFHSTTSTAANYSPVSPSMSVPFIQTTVTSARPRKPSWPFARSLSMPSWTSRVQTRPISEMVSQPRRFRMTGAHRCQGTA